MPKRRAYLLLNGILNTPDDMFTWTDRAERILQLDYGIASEKLEYKMGFLRSPRRLRELADNLASVILEYNMRGVAPSVMAHSNGNVIMCLAFARNPKIRVDRFVMLFPACFESMDDNGLNAAVKSGQVQQISFYGSEGDDVVRRGGRTSFLRRFGIGYGSASYTGLIDIDDSVQSRVVQYDRTPWGHSTFAERDVLDGFIHDVIRSD